VRADKVAFALLCALVLAGAILRGAVMLEAPPALLGHPDSLLCLDSAADKLFSDPGHPVGYAVFLRLLHATDAHLFTVVAVQHLLGLGSGVLFFLTLRRAGVSGWPSLLPATVLLLAGPVVLLEQAPMSEALFVFLLAAATYAAVRALDGRGIGWALAVGGLVGLSVLVRPIAVLALVLLLCWLAVLTPGPLLRRALLPGAALLAAVVPLGAHTVVQRHFTGATALVQAGGWYVYARAAPFADCERFTPPKGTARLCERIAVSKRPGPNDYIFDARSPAVQAYGPVRRASRSANTDLGRFGRAATIHQPLDWVDQVVSEELPRYVASGRFVREDQGMDFDLLATTLTATATPEMSARASGFYRDGDEAGRERNLGALRGYERWTRVDGAVSVVLMLLALAGVVFARGRPRSVGILLALLAFGGMLAPAFTLFYDARYAIAIWGPLSAAAGIGAWALTGLLGRRSARGA